MDDLIYYLLYICANVLITIINIVIARCSKRKSFQIAKGESEEARSEYTDTNNANIILTELIPQAIVNAEQVDVSSELKKTLAQSGVMIECGKLGIDYNKFADFISNQIDNVVHLTKQVNAKKEVVKNDTAIH